MHVGLWSIRKVLFLHWRRCTSSANRRWWMSAIRENATAAGIRVSVCQTIIFLIRGSYKKLFFKFRFWQHRIYSSPDSVEHSSYLSGISREGCRKAWSTFGYSFWMPRSLIVSLAGPTPVITERFPPADTACGKEPKCFDVADVVFTYVTISMLHPGPIQSISTSW